MLESTVNQYAVESALVPIVGLYKTEKEAVETRRTITNAARKTDVTKSFFAFTLMLVRA